MPFFKKTDEELITAPNFVHGPGFSLVEADHETHQYPVDGWYWFPSLMSAMAFFSTPEDEITSTQAKVFLIRNGYMARVLEALASANEETRLVWEEAATFRLSSPTLQGVAYLLGWSQEQILAMFAEAKKIEV